MREDVDIAFDLGDDRSGLGDDRRIAGDPHAHRARVADERNSERDVSRSRRPDYDALEPAPRDDEGHGGSAHVRHQERSFAREQVDHAPLDRAAGDARCAEDPERNVRFRRRFDRIHARFDGPDAVVRPRASERERDEDEAEMVA